MEIFKVHKPSTFFSPTPYLMIFDEKGKPFYWHTNTQKHINFNLPPGTYFTEANIKKKWPFKPYGHKPWPKFKPGALSHIKIFSYPNPNKASISLEKGFIIADPYFYNHDYEPLKKFTTLHELFHHFYHAKNDHERKNFYIHEFIEAQCDNAAKNYMLANGYNPTQISLAVKLLLRGENRKQCIRMNTTHERNNFRR